MCLGIPGKVIEVKGDIAVVDFGGVRREVDALLVNVKPGDYVIVHAGAIITKIDERLAKEMEEAIAMLIKELEDVQSRVLV